MGLDGWFLFFVFVFVRPFCFWCAHSDRYMSIHGQQGATIRTSHLTGCTEDNEVTWAPEALMQKALAVLGPVLGERHPETRACHG